MSLLFSPPPFRPRHSAPVALAVFGVLLALLSAASAGSSYTSANPPKTGPTVPGSRAMVRGGIAHAPEDAPASVKRAIWATNFLTRKPYVWGGGHAGFYDKGYDCSGTVSFLLRHAGVLSCPAGSGEFTRYGQGGRGRWITVYARHGHVFATVAGLRLDTSDMRGGDEGPRWRTASRSMSGFTARHPAGL